MAMHLLKKHTVFVVTALMYTITVMILLTISINQRDESTEKKVTDTTPLKLCEENLKTVTPTGAYVCNQNGQMSLKTSPTKVIGNENNEPTTMPIQTNDSATTGSNIPEQQLSYVQNEPLFDTAEKCTLESNIPYEYIFIKGPGVPIIGSNGVSRVCRYSDGRPETSVTERPPKNEMVYINVYTADKESAKKICSIYPEQVQQGCMGAVMQPN